MNSKFRASAVLLFGLAFLLFFQLVSDFIETIYAFGLLGTTIPPEIVCVLFFFSPFVLLLFRRGLPQKAGYFLLMSAAVIRALEVSLERGGKMITSGLGTGLLLVLLPVWLTKRTEIDEDTGREMGAGLTIALAGSILLRVTGAGTDISLSITGFSWILAGLTLILAVRSLGENNPERMLKDLPQASFGRTATLSIGIMGVLAVLFFGFTSPTVLARWTGVDYRQVVGLLSLALGFYSAAYVMGWLKSLTRPVLWIWDGLFLLAGTTAILTNQVRFSAPASTYPLDQPDLSLFQQIPLLLMILLSPVVLYNLYLLVSEIKMYQHTARHLAGGFILGALFFLIIALAQVFTTVYDYIPVVGPPLRNGFWAVFLTAGLGMALPMLLVGPIPASPLPPRFGKLFTPLIGAALLASTIWTIYRQPNQTSPAKQDILRVVTYNIQQGYSVDGKRSYAKQLAVLRKLDPDIIGLEESDVARFSGGNADEVRTISEGLGMPAYYGPKTVNGTFGIALLSRYPLSNPHTFFMTSTAEQTAAIQAQITINGKTYTLLVTHLGNDGPIIQQQQVLSRLKGIPNIIALGDFNFTPPSPQYVLTLGSLHDAWVQVGSPVPPGIDPKTVIDHVFVSPGMPVKSAAYINSPASDHPALVVEITP